MKYGSEYLEIINEGVAASNPLAGFSANPAKVVKYFIGWTADEDDRPLTAPERRKGVDEMFAQVTKLLGGAAIAAFEEDLGWNLWDHKSLGTIDHLFKMGWEADIMFNTIELMEVDGRQFIVARPGWSWSEEPAWVFTSKDPKKRIVLPSSKPASRRRR